MKTVAEIMNGRAHGFESVADIFKSDSPAEVAAPSGSVDAAEGSIEDFLKRVSEAGIEACPCVAKPEFKEDGSRDYSQDSAIQARTGTYPHYLNAQTTYPDHVFIRCSDEDKVWKIPFETEGATIT